MLKQHIMRYMTKAISSDTVLSTKRLYHEGKRSITSKEHTLEVFVCITDPYSYLLLQVIPEIQQRYGLQVRLYTVRDKQTDMFPDLAKWQQNSLIDCARLAKLYALSFPELDNFAGKNDNALDAYWAAMLHVEKCALSVTDMLAIFAQYWQNIPSELVAQKTAETELMPLASCKMLIQNQEYQVKQGHYLPATIKYAGEWYWAIDRLDHLESRLNRLLVSAAGGQVKYDRQTKHLLTHPATPETAAHPVTLYFSARSPYSYLGLELAVKLCNHYGCPLIVKPVLPMMMRGMNVPQTKKMYIFHDTKREAKKHGIDYGFVADPLGKAVENCYALFALAKSQGKAISYLLEFARAVNSQGLLADNGNGMQVIVQRSGLNWHEAKRELNNPVQPWRQEVEDNMNELNNLGLWGVPCFHYQDTVAWGQDRLWVIEQAILSKKKA